MEALTIEKGSNFGGVRAVSNFGVTRNCFTDPRQDNGLKSALTELYQQIEMQSRGFHDRVAHWLAVFIHDGLSLLMQVTLGLTVIEHSIFARSSHTSPQSRSVRSRSDPIIWDRDKYAVESRTKYVKI